MFVWTGAVLAIAGVAVLHASWRRRERSAAANAAGWLVLTAGVVSAGHGAGAWGIAVAALAATGAAFVVLAHAGWRSPAGRATPPARRAHMLAGDGVPRHLVRRIVTFAVTVPAAAVAATIAALGVRVLASVLGAGEANANVLALFAMPIGWGVLMAVLPMQRRRASQAVTLVVPVGLGGMLLLAGSA